MDINNVQKRIQEVKESDPIRLYKMSCENLYASAVSLVALITGLSLPEAEIKFARALLDVDSLDIIDDDEVLELTIMYRALIGMTYSKNMLYTNSYAYISHAMDVEENFSQVECSGHVKKYGYLHIYIFCKLGVFTDLSTVDYANLNMDVLNQETAVLCKKLE